jgi:hypothetical protein
VSAQPAERGDPLDPQLVLDQLPVDERGFFLNQYRDAVENARDPVGWKQLRRVLLRWRFRADAVADPGYQEALDAARGLVGSGTLLEDPVLRQMPGLPSKAFDMLVRTLARTCEDPCDPGIRQAPAMLRHDRDHRIRIISNPGPDQRHSSQMSGHRHLHLLKALARVKDWLSVQGPRQPSCPHECATRSLSFYRQRLLPFQVPLRWHLLPQE